MITITVTPAALKLANIKSAFKRVSQNCKIDEYFNNGIFAEHHVGFRQGFILQYYLINE